MENGIYFIGHSLDDVTERITNSVIKSLQNINKPNPNESNQLLTRYEVAKLFKVSLPTLRTWTKENRIKSYRIGSRVYYKQNEVNEALTSMNYNPNKSK